jgi:chorismate mutase
VKAIRGAITVDGNTPEAIGAATSELLVAIKRRNDLSMHEVVSVLFTMTPDLNADFPARAARLSGWDVPLLDMVEVDVPGSLRCCLRALIHVDRTEPVRNAYLRGARVLRPDLEERDGDT